MLLVIAISFAGIEKNRVHTLTSTSPDMRSQTGEMMMTIDADATTSSSAASDSQNDSRQKTPAAPYENVLTSVVTRIKNEPFLFVIAIAVLVIGLSVMASGIGTPDLRFIIIIIAALASIVILGYYVQTVVQLQAKNRRDRLIEQQSGRAPGSQTLSDNAKDGSSTAGNKYVTHLNGAVGVAIGDQATIEQHFDKTGQNTPVTHKGVAQEADALRSAAEQELAQHQRNLARLRAKKAVYAAGEEPLSLLNQIDAEEREIERLQEQLNISGTSGEAR